MITLEYRLTGDEIAESLMSLNYKREGAFKRWNVYALSGLGVLLVLWWWREPDRFYLFWGLLMDVGLLFYLLYGAPGLRKRKAQKMANVGGVYRLAFTGEGISAGDENKSRCFDGKSLFLESETVLTIRIDSAIFCIPKRALTREISAELERIVGKKGCRKEILKTK